MEKPTGYMGGLSHGIGLGVLNDQRDNTLNPHQGSSLINVNVTSFSSFIGSDFNFTRFEIDFRKYYSFLSRNIIAFQFTGMSNIGDPPFKLSANLGGRRILRGYHSSRYIDKQMLAIQAELRMKIYQRIGAVAFAGAGTVFTKNSDAIKRPIKPSLGGGFRFMIDKQNQANLRFDVAYGMDGLAYYFSYGEAF
jgi:outer membrane protein assembly factor BamA